jgi:hypothetical protein
MLPLFLFSLTLGACAHIERAANAVASFADVDAALSCYRSHGLSPELAACLGVQVVTPALRDALGLADEKLTTYLAARAGAGAEVDIASAQAEADAAVARLEDALAAAR